MTTRKKFVWEWDVEKGGACAVNHSDEKVFYFGLRCGNPFWLLHYYQTKYHAAKRDPTYQVLPELGSQASRDCEFIRSADVDQADVLVTGCGGGNNLQQLKHDFEPRSVTACDFSSFAVNYCARHFPDVQFNVCSIDELTTTYKSDSFDVILALDVTEHVPFDTYLFFLFEAMKLLRPKGRLAILPGMTLRPEHINLLPLMKIQEHLHKVGFEVQEKTPKGVIGRKPDATTTQV